MDDNASWRTLLLEDLAAPVRHSLVGGPFGSDLVSSDYSATGVPVIRGENLAERRWVGGDFVFVPAEKAAQLAPNTAGPLDIVFTQRGANHYRQVAVVPPRTKDRFVVSQSQMKLTVDPEKADPLFVYYLFRSPIQQDYLRRHAIQTGVPHTNLSILRRVPLRVPPLPLQRAAVSVLGVLDDKIELNHRMSETLEAIARALFRSWFADSDPTGGGGRPGGRGRRQPASWSFGSLLEQAELLSGGTPKTDRPEYWGGNVAWASAKDVSQCGQTFLTRTERTITRRGLDESATRLIPPLATIVVARGATTGRLVMLAREMAMNQTCYALVSKIGAPFALYCHVREQIEALVHAAHGSVFDTITTNTFTSSRVRLPPVDLLLKFERAVEPMFQRVRLASEESAVLAAARDTLLPRIMAGEIRIKDAERIVARYA